VREGPTLLHKSILASLFPVIEMLRVQPVKRCVRAAAAAGGRHSRLNDRICTSATHCYDFVLLTADLRF
jgi:hypothetical protein